MQHCEITDMPSQTPSLIPITILTGFLGAGKTTLLNRILQSGQTTRRIAVLVNDFGAINIDGQLLTHVQGEMMTLENGCICCTIRDELVNAVHALVTMDDAPDHIIIEASGVSDPAQVVLHFNRSVLRNWVEIDSIIALVDAEQGRDIQLKLKRLAEQQIRVADLIILNKVDLVDEAQLQTMREWIASLRPKDKKTTLLEAINAEVPLEQIVGTQSYSPQTAFLTVKNRVHVYDADETTERPEHSDHSLVFTTWKWTSDQPISLMALREVLDDLPENIFRVKGLLHAQEMPDKRVILQMVGKRASFTEDRAWGSAVPGTQIVMIGESAHLEGDALARRLNGCLAEPVSQTPGPPLLDGMMTWLRAKR